MKIKNIFKTVVVLNALMCAVCFGADNNESVNEFNQAYLAYQSYWEQKDYKAALEKIVQAIDLSDGILDKTSDEYFNLKFTHAFVLEKNREYDVAVNVLDGLLEAYHKRDGMKSLSQIDVLMYLGKINIKKSSSSSNYTIRKRAFNKGKRNFNRALELVENNKNNNLYIKLLLETGSALLNQAKSKASRKYIDEAYHLLKQSENQQAPALGYVLFLLGRYHGAFVGRKDSIPFYEDAIDIWSNHSGDYDQYQSIARANLIALYTKQGYEDKATEQCLAIGAKQPWRIDQEQQPLYKIPPNYPSKEQRLGKTGYVILEFTVNKAGFVTNPSVIEVVGGENFATSALKAIKQFRYAPRFVDGEPVDTHNIQHKITYQMK